MPRGSGRPDLSQRPRREAPGLLTGLAILERELGQTVHQLHQVERALDGKPTAAQRRTLQQQKAELEGRRLQTIRLLDEMQAEYEERVARADAGHALRAGRNQDT